MIAAKEANEQTRLSNVKEVQINRWFDKIYNEIEKRINLAIEDGEYKYVFCINDVVHQSYIVYPIIKDQITQRLQYLVELGYEIEQKEASNWNFDRVIISWESGK